MLVNRVAQKRVNMRQGCISPYALATAPVVATFRREAQSAPRRRDQRAHRNISCSIQATAEMASKAGVSHQRKIDSLILWDEQHLRQIGGYQRSPHEKRVCVQLPT